MAAIWVVRVGGGLVGMYAATGEPILEKGVVIQSLGSKRGLGGSGEGGGGVGAGAFMRTSLPLYFFAYVLMFRVGLCCNLHFDWMVQGGEQW